MNIISCLYGEYIILLGGCDEEKKENTKTIHAFNPDTLEYTLMNSLEIRVFRGMGIVFSAPMNLLEKLKEH